MELLLRERRYINRREKITKSLDDITSLKDQKVRGSEEGKVVEFVRTVLAGCLRKGKTRFQKV